MNSRDEILNKIKRIRIEAHPDTAYIQDEIYQPVDNLLSCFIAEIEAIAGKCYLAENEQDLINALKDVLSERNIQKVYAEDEVIREFLKNAGIEIHDTEVFPEELICGITNCEFLIARTGSVMISTGLGSGRKAHAFPPVHLVFAHENQLVKYPQDALVALEQKYPGSLPSQITTITGPSRTADIEKTLVMGAHGPKELIIFVRRNK
jgi:L-lactate dehydrogenase complex protein LldG